MNTSLSALKAVLLVLALVTMPALADEIVIPVGQQGSAKAAVDKPKTGMKAEVVEQKYGAPIEKSAAVGKPPISHWTYADYTVYFENDRVITTVLNPNPAPAAEPAPVTEPAPATDAAPATDVAPAAEPATTAPAAP